MPASLSGLDGKLAAVTAGEGAIAPACAAALLERGAEVRVLIRHEPLPKNLDILVAVYDVGCLPTPAEGDAETDWDAAVNDPARRMYTELRAAAVAMREREKGSIVVAAPEIAFAGVRGASAVAAAAGSVLSASRALAIELAPLVRINSIVYGCIEGDPFSEWLRSTDPNRSQALDGTLTLLERFGRPEEVGAAAAFLASDRASFITAHQLVVDGGYLVH